MKPILSKSTNYAFDSTQAHTFIFTIPNDSTQPVANKLIIKNNETNEIVYSEIEETLQLKHVLPANSLQNGILYKVIVKTINKNGINSEESEPILFYCYSTPTLNISVEPNQIIGNSSIDVNIIYTQSEGEQLQMYAMQLFDSQKKLLSESGIKYNLDKKISFNGLTDNTSYYIKAHGQTINHMEVETNYIPFNVNYSNPYLYSYCLAENRYEFGDIQISSNLTSIEGASDNAKYVDGSFIDTINGASVCFNKGFKLSDNFTLFLNGYDFKCNETILTLSEYENDNISLYWRKNNANKNYIELVAKDKSVTCLNYSNEIECCPTDIINIWICRARNYYGIAIYKDIL